MPFSRQLSWVMARVYIWVFAWVCSFLAAPSYGAEYSMGGVGFSASSVQVTAGTVACDKPVSEQDALATETAISAIWQLDLQNIDLGYIDDDAPVSSAVLSLIPATKSSAQPERVSSSGEFAMRLDNGWSLGLTYETIDATVQVGSAVLADTKSPIYEGPLFVATLKFR